MLPSDTDTQISAHIAREVHRRLPGAELLPPLAYGLSTEHSGFPDTISLTLHGALTMIHDVLDSICSQRRPQLIVVVNGHGGNADIANAAVSDINYRSANTKALVRHAFSSGARQEAVGQFGVFDAHAGSAESSVMAAIGWPVPDGEYSLDHLRSAPTKKGLLRLFPSHEISAGGIITSAESVVVDRDTGQRMIERAVADICEDVLAVLEEIRQVTLGSL